LYQAGFLSNWSRLLQLHFLVDHVLPHDWVELLKRELFGGRFFVLGRGVEMTSAGC
jgi:hypothetical protein